jgi:hypothetical protein
MTTGDFDLQGWMREQKQGPFNQKALQESIGGYVDFTNYNSLSEAEEEEEDMMDMEDDWNKPEVDDTPDEDAIDAMAMKQAKKAAKSIKGLNPDKDIQDLLYGTDDDDLYEGMSIDAIERMEGLVNAKHLEAFKQIFKKMVNDWMNDGFDQEDIVNYISGVGGFSTSHPFMNQDDLEDEGYVGGDFDSMMEEVSANTDLELKKKAKELFSILKSNNLTPNYVSGDIKLDKADDSVIAIIEDTDTGTGLIRIHIWAWAVSKNKVDLSKLQSQIQKSLGNEFESKSGKTSFNNDNIYTMLIKKKDMNEGNFDSMMEY